MFPLSAIATEVATTAATVATTAATVAAAVAISGGVTRGKLPASSTLCESKEEREARRRSVSRGLKENGFEVLGDVVETSNNICNAVENFIDANPLSQAIRFFAEKEFTDKAISILKLGDHVAVDRIANYTHHGIYGGKGNVMEYDGGEIKESSLKTFFGDEITFYIVKSEAIYSPDEIWRRACSRRGEKDYNILWNNCEHFARWCRNGEKLKMTTTTVLCESEIPEWALEQVKKNS